MKPFVIKSISVSTFRIIITFNPIICTMKKIRLLTLALFFQICLSAQSQQIPAQYSTLNAHSHNDYANVTPFWLAYNNHFGSIEADVWAINGDLFVAHNRSDIKTERTLDTLYIEPVVKLFTENKGQAWSGRRSTFQLMIDLKTPVEPTLAILVEKLNKYPDVFDQKVNENAVRIVITGNRPDPSDFIKYPEFIFFDGILKMKYDEQQLKRVALYSENLKNIISWNGEGEINEKEKIRLQSVIDSVHYIDKKIRFWNAPDNINAWNTFIKMKSDYINTDQIVKLSEYLNSRGKK
jgi:alkaline phosphatase